MRIGDRVIGPGHPPYVIAELGVNHDGGRDRALQLVEAAHRAGADAVKLQWFEADRLLSRAARLTRYQTARGAKGAFECDVRCGREIARARLKEDGQGAGG